jgi:uncharacterized HhH-GPD family protein
VVTTHPPDRLWYTGDEAADRFLAAEPLALLIGFVLDQQVTVQKAFSGPLELQRRMGGRLDAAAIADADPARLTAIFQERPALHRFPGAMAGRVQALCAAVLRDYGGDAGRIWTGARDGADLKRRLLGLPGVGEMKAATIIAVLAKRFDLQLTGLEAVTPRHATLADVDSAESLARYQAGKRAYKAALRAGGTGATPARS